MKAQDAYFWENDKDEVQLVGYRSMNENSTESFTNVKDSIQLHRKRFKNLKDQEQARRKQKRQRSSLEDCLRTGVFLFCGF